MSLVAVRHGETEWSAGGRHTSRTDVVLTETGLAQARGLVPTLAGWRFTLVLTSPMQRARATAEAAGFGDRAVVDPDLCEWDYGDYEGRTTNEIRAEVPGWTIWRGPVPAGETARQVADRADLVIARARAADGDVLVFGHGHMLRVLAARWIGLEPERGGSLALGTGTVSVLGWEREEPVVERWNLNPAYP